MKFIQHKLFTPTLLSLLLFTTFAIYNVGLTGDFIFDDFINIVANNKAHLSSLSFSQIFDLLSSGIASFLGRPLSMLSFGLNHYATGLEPYYFKLTNVVIHLLVGLGIFLLCKELLTIGLTQTNNKEIKVQLISLIITACWILHPLNTSTVLYVVQRMTQLSALVSIYSLLYYCRFRQQNNTTPRQALVATGVLVCLIIIGILCKENAVLIVPLIIVIELFILHFQRNSAGQIIFLKLFFTLLVVIPVGLLLIYFISNPEIIFSGYENRTFTLWERLLTQTRVIWMYIGWVLMPNTQQFTFYYDDFNTSISFISPLSTLFASAGLVALLGFIFYFRNKLPWLCFGLAFFLVGHTIESTIISLELVFEHRNYLPGFGLLFGGITTLFTIPKQFFSRKLASIFLGLFFIFLAHGTYIESRHWSNTPLHLETLVLDRPYSHRINYALASSYYQYGKILGDPNYIKTARHYFTKSVEYDPSFTRGYIGVIMTESELGINSKEALINELTRKLRMEPLNHRTLLEVFALTECHYVEQCKFEKRILIRIYNAVAENQLSPVLFRQGMLGQIATGIYLHFNNIPDGLGLLYLAQSLSNTLTTLDLKIIQLEISSGNFPAAIEHLARSRQKAVENPRLELVLEELEKFLNKQEAQ